MVKEALAILKGLENLEGFSVVLRTRETGINKGSLRKLIAGEVTVWKKGLIVKESEIRIDDKMPTDPKTIVFILHRGTPLLHKIIT